ncbi:MAG: tetratricopeptide repeat protein [Patescibacteria group bacterium]
MTKNPAVFLYSCCAVIFLLFIAGFNFENFLASKRVLGTETQNQIYEQELLKYQKIYWKDFLAENPTYFDGWIELAQIELKLGNLEEAKLSFEKAKTINPNSSKN